MPSLSSKAHQNNSSTDEPIQPVDISESLFKDSAGPLDHKGSAIAERDQNVNAEHPGYDAQLHTVLAATSRQIYSLYSIVNNTGTLTVATHPRMSEKNILSADRVIVPDTIHDAVGKLYEEAAAKCLMRNSRSSTDQVDVTFRWTHSVDFNITVPVTYRGPIIQVVKLFTTGVITDSDLEKAGLKGCIKKLIEE